MNRHRRGGHEFGFLERFAMLLLIFLGSLWLIDWGFDLGRNPQETDPDWLIEILEYINNEEE